MSAGEVPVLGARQATEAPGQLLGRFEELFERLYAPTFGLTYRVLGDRLETEDVLQDAFLKLAESPVLDRPDAEAAAWLRRVCLNLSFNRLRDRRRARERLEQAGRLDASAAVGSDDPVEVALRHERQAQVRRALAKLPERQRDCLVLRHSGYSYAEIAATLSIAIGSVGVLLARAERAFRDAYEEHRDDPTDNAMS
jgi:RNA polymerase sigma-70 factor (ECF subfamily)